MKSNLVYNVYLEDVNKREIVSYNIFMNLRFYNDLLKLKKQFNKDVKQFKKENDILSCLEKFDK